MNYEKYNFLFYDTVNELQLLPPYKLTITAKNYDNDKITIQEIQENKLNKLPKNIINFIHKNEKMIEYINIFSDDYHLYFNVNLKFSSSSVDYDNVSNGSDSLNEFYDINVLVLRNLLNNYNL